MRGPVACALVGALFVSCDRGAEVEAAGATAEAASTGPAPPVGLEIAFGAPRLVASSAYLSRAMVVEAVYRATALSGAIYAGRIVNTGTIQVTSVGPKYVAEPSDRLVVEWGGQRHEFVVKDAQGNMQAPDSTSWLLSPHVLSYRHTLGDATADIDVRYDGSGFEVSVQGHAGFGGTRTEIALQASGRSAGTRGLDGQDVSIEYAVTGTLRGDGFEVVVDERHSSQLVSAISPRLLPSQRGSASKVSTVIRSVLTCDGAEYRFDGVEASGGTAERGGRTTNQHATVKGHVLLDGQPFGECVMVAGAPVLRTSRGEISLALPQ